MRRTYVKICGITSEGDADAAVSCGVDAIGLVFHPASPRAVAVERAARICRLLPPFVSAVGLFVDATDAWLNQVLGSVPLDLLQFHGDESPAVCGKPGRRFIKALRVGPQHDIAKASEPYVAAAAILLDTFQTGIPGGTGEVFDWSLLPRDVGKPVVLAGGLSAANVARAIRTVRPFAVDVSTGVESSPGRKDLAKMMQFMDAVRQGDSDRG